MSCLYSNNFPVSASRIVPANSVVVADCVEINGVSSHAAHMHSCIIFMSLVFDRVFAASPNVIVCVDGMIGIGSWGLMLFLVCGGIGVQMTSGISTHPWRLCSCGLEWAAPLDVVLAHWLVLLVGYKVCLHWACCSGVVIGFWN